MPAASARRSVITVCRRTRSIGRPMPRSDTSDSVATRSDSRTGALERVTSRSSPRRAAVGERPALAAPARNEPNEPAARTPCMTTESGPVDVVLPCLDEAASLPWVLSRLPAGFRAIVADNGSTDGSAQIAAGLGATVVPVPQRGFGAAAHAGLEVATAEFVCFCDADGSMDPAQLPRVLDPVRAGPPPPRPRPRAGRRARPRPRPAPSGPACLAGARARRQRRSGPDDAP